MSSNTVRKNEEEENALPTPDSINEALLNKDFEKMVQLYDSSFTIGKNSFFRIEAN